MLYTWYQSIGQFEWNEQILKKYSLLKPLQEEPENLNTPVSIKETEYTS